MFDRNIVVELATRSITEFSLHVGNSGPHFGHIPPDIWVGEKKLYQYQTLDDGERQRYKLTYDNSLSDPYQYVEDNTAVTTTVLVPG